jgi:hypothetical protein
MHGGAACGGELEAAVAVGFDFDSSGGNSRAVDFLRGGIDVFIE